MHTAERLLKRGDQVIGVDNLNAYYDVRLKQARLARLCAYPNFQAHTLDVADRPALSALFEAERFSKVVHLAAQAGVRYSLQNPQAYIDSNLVGFGNILEGCRHAGVAHLVYASSSSVYGGNTRMPFSEQDQVDHPISLYAATKKANELMAHTYSHLFQLPTTGLRFFTVYGPWGRPDMALFLFTRALLEGRPIEVFNHGRMQRDFTYVDDIVEGVVRVLDQPPQPAGASEPPYRVFNIGNHQPVDLMALIETLEAALGVRGEKIFLPMQPGDVPATLADTRLLEAAIGFAPATPVALGIERFVRWYRDYYPAH
jgi:UDP-glucuronate 4-epimerase